MLPAQQKPFVAFAAQSVGKTDRAIAAGQVVQIDGGAVSEELREALITENGKVIYPVIDDIPILLSERGIGTTQLQDF
ncbi:MAG: Trm112 family protein [Xanthomonadales bacterium]|nr:Trm112 family protein [Xanthomonadales bacterium]